MKTSFLSLIFISLTCLNLCAQSPTEYFKPNSIKFCNTKFFLAWSAHPQDNHYTQEYLPNGESFEHYNQMFTMSIILTDHTPIEFVQAKIAELEQRKKTDPITNYILAENNGEYILEFLVSDSQNEQLNIVELDIHHYKRIKLNGKNATVLSFYSSRAYGDGITKFIQSIPENRNAWYEAISHLNINPKFP